MAIKVKHEGNVTSRAVAGAIGGQARRNAEDSKALSQRAAQENMAANRPLGGAHASPAAPGHVSATPGHATAPMVSAPRPPTDPERAAAVQRAIGDVKNSQQMELDEHKAGLARQEYDYKLSSQQKSEISKITDGLDQARQSGRFTDEELAELERQAYAKIMDVKPLPTPVTELPKPNVQVIDGVKYVQNGQKWDPVQTPAAPQSAAEVYGGTHVDEQGRRWGVDAHGKLYEVGGGVDKTEEARRKYILDAVDGIMNEDNAPATPAQIDEVARRAGETWDRLFGKPKQPDAGGGDPVLRARLNMMDPQQALDPFNIFPAAGSAAPAPSGAPAKPAAEDDEFAAFRRK